VLIRQLDGSPPSVAHAPEGASPSTAHAAAASAEPADTGSRDAREATQQAVAAANKSLQALTPSLEFEIDPNTKAVIVRLVDRTDRQVLRQVPSQEMIEIARAIERMQINLLRSRA